MFCNECFQMYVASALRKEALYFNTTKFLFREKRSYLYMFPVRRVLVYAIFVACTILLGLLSRSSLSPKWAHLYLGDVWWALMVYWLFCLLFLKKGIGHIVNYSICFCFAIELSQLYQAEWINLVRATRLGGLVLGHGFLWSDLVAYSIGIAAGAAIEWGSLRLSRR